MKNIALVLVFIFPICLSGQSQKIKTLEAGLDKANMPQYIKSKLQLSDWYNDEGFYNKAISSAVDAHDAAKKLNSEVFMAFALNKEAKAYAQKGSSRDLKKAESIFRKSLELLAEFPEKEVKIDNLEQLILLAKKRGDLNEVRQLDHQILVINGKTVSNVLEENVTLNLQVDSMDAQLEDLDSEKAALDLELVLKRERIASMTQAQIKAELLIAQQKNLVDSLTFNKLIDSIRLEKQELILQQNAITLKEQEARARLQTAQKNLFIALAAIIGILAYSFFSRYKNIKHYNGLLESKNETISKEKKRSDELLLNILPATVADELKQKGFARTRYYENATVLFSDFKGFSGIAKRLSPEELVNMLDECFKGYDQIIAKYQLEKIKTIGDSYMCAGGIPEPDDDHAQNVVNAAFEMQQLLDQMKLERKSNGLPFFEARIGIHTGPIIAGIVGTKKFAYDIWGDTVNVASRMENTCEVGQVNVSANTYELIKAQFDCQHRGKVTAKNMGEIDMYYVLSENNM